MRRNRWLPRAARRTRPRGQSAEHGEPPCTKPARRSRRAHRRRRDAEDRQEEIGIATRAVRRAPTAFNATSGRALRDVGVTCLSAASLPDRGVDAVGALPLARVAIPISSWRSRLAPSSIVGATLIAVAGFVHAPQARAMADCPRGRFFAPRGRPSGWRLIQHTSLSARVDRSSRSESLVSIAWGRHAVSARGNRRRCTRVRRGGVLLVAYFTSSRSVRSSCSPTERFNRSH